MKGKEERGFIKGIAYCIQLIEKEFGLGEFIFTQSCIPFKDFEKAEVDEYDLKEVRKIDEEIKILEGGK